MKNSATVIILISAVHVGCSEALFEWLFSEKSQETGNGNGDRVIRSMGVKFEVQTADDKFLQLKDALDNLSPLDACYHIVVYRLKKQCSGLSEEELGKLSVQLLNCQSAVEERPTYKCTDDMTLAECTKEMDPTTWNSYHIVSNRARSLCYATQQNQFRRLAEATVNQLVTSAHGQLEYLKQLQDGQEQLHSITTDTVRKLYESQADLIGNQQNMHVAQDGVLQQIHNNMVELKQEKAMITTGNKELAELTENIRTKLDEATGQLSRQENAQLESHQKILSDLTYIQKKSHDALNKLDESSQYLMKNHQEMLGHYSSMYENMMRINSTVSHLLATVTAMQRHLDDKINWFSHLLNIADDKLSLLTCGAVHIGYFLFAALAASFLQTPSFTRVFLFLLVSLNATMEIQCGQSLDILSLSVCMIAVCTVNWLYIWWCRRQYSSHETSDPSPVLGALPAADPEPNTENEDRNQSPDTTTAGSPLSQLSPVELKHLTSTLGRLYQSLNESKLAGGDNSIANPLNRVHNSSLNDPIPSTSAFTPVFRSRTEQARPDSSTMQDNVAKVRRYLLENLEEDTSSVGGDFDHMPNMSSTPRRPHRPTSRNSSSASKSLCQGFTKIGGACKLTCVHGSDFCYRHKDRSLS